MNKMPNKIVYWFLSKKSLDLFFAFFLPDTYVARTDIADTIFFALAIKKV